MIDSHYSLFAEARLEDRFNKLYEKTSTSTQVQVSYTKTDSNTATLKKKTRISGISMIFSKEENKKQKFSDKPASATDFERIFENSAAKANYFRKFYKGVKFNSNDSLQNRTSDSKVPSGSAERINVTTESKPSDIYVTNSNDGAQRNNICVANSANDCGAYDSGDDVADTEYLRKGSDLTSSKVAINSPTTSMANKYDGETSSSIDNTYSNFLGTIYWNIDKLSNDSNGNIGIFSNINVHETIPILTHDPIARGFPKSIQKFENETKPPTITSKTNSPISKLSMNNDKIEETINCDSSTQDAVQRKVADIIKDFNTNRVKNNSSFLSNKLIRSKITIKESHVIEKLDEVVSNTQESGETNAEYIIKIKEDD